MSYEQQILDIIQDGFPITERPYAVIAELVSNLNENQLSKLQITEQTVYEVVENFYNAGVIRRIGGVYDSRKLGFVSRLCAGKVPVIENGAMDDNALEKFATVVMGIPAITHNYVRSHEYNVWFTVIAESEDSIFSIVRQLQAKTKLYDVHCLSSTQMFKINTVMKNNRTLRNTQYFNNIPCIDKECRNTFLFESDKLRIRLLSGDIPHTLTPFVDLCSMVGCDLQRFIEGVHQDLSSKRMRRFGAILRHQNAGFAHNAMVCFGVNDLYHSARGVENIYTAEIGRILASNPLVSHCYVRPSFEGFPYNIYAMFHESSSEKLDEAIVFAAETIQKKCDLEGLLEYVVLYSVRELKKTSFSFFDV